MESNKPCPKCREQGHDSKGDHLFLMSSGDRYCCTKKEYHDDGEVYYEDLDGGSGDASPEPATTFSALLANNEPPVANATSTSSTLEFVGTPATSTESSSTTIGNGPTEDEVQHTIRGITPSTFRKYGTRAVTKNGTVVELVDDVYEAGSGKVADKVRKLPKDIFNRNQVKSLKGVPVQLYGQWIFPRAKRLLITEGELDAQSAYQMLEKYKVACVSLPSGANVKALVDNKEYLKGFKEIVICVDQDKDGDKVSKEIAKFIPRAKFMKMSEKDANAMLVSGKVTEFISAFFDAEIYKPATVVRVKDILKKVMEKPKIGTPWPWQSLTDATYGRRPGEGMYVGAGVKIGKSEWINELIAYDVQAGRKIGVLKYEEVPHLTVKRVAGKIDGICYHKPGVIYNDADLERRALAMHDELYMYPAFGPATWADTSEYIRYAAMCGCETIIIDPLTKLTNSLDSSSTEEQLRKLSDEIACMAQDLGFFYIITCHLKAPANGPPHERGGHVHSNQFRGSRAMMENCFYMLGIERNKDPDLSDDERNTSTFVLLEDRNFGNATKFIVKYNPADQSYREPPLVF